MKTNIKPIKQSVRNIDKLRELDSIDQVSQKVVNLNKGDMKNGVSSKHQKKMSSGVVFPPDYLHIPDGFI